MTALQVPVHNSAMSSRGAKPILKWAGGKTQLLPELISRMPSHFNRYLEPFLGGGALFFATQPAGAVIADSNPELINLYRSVANELELVIEHLERYKNRETEFYRIRQLDWSRLSPPAAAARTIYLNRTCFNGLYRVNRRGMFNVPFGKYKSPRILDRASLAAASAVLRKSTIVCGDYKTVLREHAGKGDFVYLDPPYLPISRYSDFKRYTKEQFYEDDHIELASEVRRLREIGCHVLLTNSNHPLVHELYKDFQICAVPSRRNISAKGDSRLGEDIIVRVEQKSHLRIHSPTIHALPKQVAKFPSTRFMGSKSKLLPQIWDLASRFEFDTVVDLFSGSAVVGYMFKCQGKSVISNDYMAISATWAKALIENSKTTISDRDLTALLDDQGESDRFVQTTFKQLYFCDADNRFIDVIRRNVKRLKCLNKRFLAMAALTRACLKRRPRGIFTYIGFRYDDGRNDLKLSLQEHFIEAVRLMNSAVFDNGQTCRASQGDALQLRLGREQKKCLIYMDPPYFSPFSDNEYVRRYHFVEGLARDWKGVEIQEHTLTKKFKSYPSPFSSRLGASDAFDRLFSKFSRNILLVSYSSNSLPTKDEMLALLSKHKKHVEVVPVDYKYSFGNQGHMVGKNKNSVQEYLFVGY